MAADDEASCQCRSRVYHAAEFRAERRDMPRTQPMASASISFTARRRDLPTASLRLNEAGHHRRANTARPPRPAFSLHHADAFSGKASDERYDTFFRSFHAAFSGRQMRAATLRIRRRAIFAAILILMRFCRDLIYYYIDYMLGAR